MIRLCSEFTLLTLRPAIFFDRDGILIRDLDYVNTEEKTEIIPEAIEAIKKARERGFLIFVVTNQAGVARNFYTELECVNFNKWVMQEFAMRGAAIDQLVYCPSHPEFSKGVSCSCRKPGAGMLTYLSNHWNLDISRSLMIGDKDSDVLSGQTFGVASRKVNSGPELLELVLGHVDYFVDAPLVEIGKANDR